MDEKGNSSSKRRIVYGVLVAAAIIALCLAFTSVIPSLSSDTQTSVETEAQSNQNSEEQLSDDSDDETCDHDWTITYKTVHHDAVTHTETVDPVYVTETTYHTVCNECQEVIDGEAAQHIKETGHSGYSTNVPITNEVLESEGYTIEVTDTPAYEETVPDKVVCTKCSAERSVGDESTD